MRTWKQIRRALQLSEHYEHDVCSFTLEDYARLEAAFPGCTVALDHNPRVMTWKNFRFTPQPARELRHAPEDGWGAVLVARRADEHGAYVQTRSDCPVRIGANYFVEAAVYVPSKTRWVVLR